MTTARTAPLALLGALMVASLFWYSALLDMAPNWPAAADYVAARGLPLPRLLAAGAMTLEVIAPAALFMPRLRRLALAALALYCVLTALLFHDFWTLQGDERTGAAFHFLKNMALAGALLMTLGAGRAGHPVEESRT
jgi:putative oxidoreductase